MALPGAATDREGVDVAEGTTVVCPRRGCHAQFTIGVTFENVSITGAAMNVAVTCPRCGLTFDATGGGDGTFSTVDGRLMRVADELRRLGQAHPGVEDELRALRAEVERLGDLSADSLERTVEQVAPTAAPLLLRVLRDPATPNSAALVATLLAIIAMVLGR